MINLNDRIKEISDKEEEARVLVIRKGVNVLLENKSLEDFYKEQCELNVDKKVFMRGCVKNKLARYNLCFGYESQEPDYENKKWHCYDLVEFENYKTALTTCAEKIDILISH